MPITINGSGTVTGISAGGLPDGSINNADLATDAVSTSKILNGAVTTAKLGSAEQSGLAKAWVNFNGQGTVTIRASYNVSSITDNGTGIYTVNFTTAMADANYSVTGMADDFGSFGGVYNIRNTTLLAGSVGVWYIQNNSPGFVDPSIATIAIFR